MEFKIEILSPVHIGCGETYTGLNYIFANGEIYYFEPEDLLGSVSYKVDEFVRWLEDESNLNLKQFCVLNKISIDSLKGFARYHLPAKVKIIDSDKIQQFIHQGRHCYIPGTEIKGAMRTAILYNLISKDQNLYQVLQTKIEKFHSLNKGKIASISNQKRPDGKIKRDLNKEMAKITEEIERQTLYSPLQKDANFDVLKFLFLSHSDLRVPSDTLAAAYAEPFNTSGHYRTFYEYCQPGVAFDFKDLTIENNPLKINQLGFNKHQKNIVDDIRNVFNFCHDFSKDLIEEEIGFFKKHGKSNIVAHLEAVSWQNTPDSPVLRIGKDEGYLSLTIGLLVKKRNPDLYENVLIHATNNKSYDSMHGGPLPKSRKIVHYEGKELTAGWVKFILRENVIESKKLDGNSGKKDSVKAIPSKDSLEALRAKWSKR